MIVKLLRQCWECLSNRQSLRFPSWQFSALQSMHLLICLGKDKYLLTLPGFVLICLNSAQCHRLKLPARALLTQPQVLNLGARYDWRPASLHAVSWPRKSFPVHVTNATHLARIKGKGVPGGRERGPVVRQQCGAIEVSNWMGQHLLKTWDSNTQELLYQHNPTATDMSW